MKYLAKLNKDDPKDRCINILQVQAALKSPNWEQWKGRTYYSLNDNIEMVAKVNFKPNSISPHFAYKKGQGGNEHSGGGESLQHSLLKEAIAKHKKIKIIIGKKEVNLKFSEVELEAAFYNNQYYADLYCKVEEVVAEDKCLQLPIGSMLVLELKYKHKVETHKQKYYQNNNIASLEVTIPRSLGQNNNLDSLLKEIEAKLDFPFYAHRLHDPNWKDHYANFKNATLKQKSITKNKKYYNHYLKSKYSNSSKLQKSSTVKSYNYNNTIVSHKAHINREEKSVVESYELPKQTSHSQAERNTITNNFSQSHSIQGNTRPTKVDWCAEQVKHLHFKNEEKKKAKTNKIQKIMKKILRFLRTGQVF